MGPETKKLAEEDVEEKRSGVRLDERPARTDLTSREVARLLGGFVGALCDMSSAETVREAMRWWAETDAAWNFVQVVSYPSPPGSSPRSGGGGS